MPTVIPAASYRRNAFRRLEHEVPPEETEAMVLLIWLSLFAALVLLLLLPFVFVEVMSVGLLKLHLSANAALLLILAVIVGSFINIPVKRIQRSATAVYHPLAILGLLDLWPELQRVRSETAVAVNVGGCLIRWGWPSTSWSILLLMRGSLVRL
jgi:uncharacterized membrane protein